MNGTSRNVHPEIPANGANSAATTEAPQHLPSAGHQANSPTPGKETNASKAQPAQAPAEAQLHVSEEDHSYSGVLHDHRPAAVAPKCGEHAAQPLAAAPRLPISAKDDAAFATAEEGSHQALHVESLLISSLMDDDTMNEEGDEDFVTAHEPSRLTETSRKAPDVIKPGTKSSAVAPEEQRESEDASASHVSFGSVSYSDVDLRSGKKAAKPSGPLPSALRKSHSDEPLRTSGSQPPNSLEPSKKRVIGSSEEETNAGQEGQLKFENTLLAQGSDKQPKSTSMTGASGRGTVDTNQDLIHSKYPELQSPITDKRMSYVRPSDSSNANSEYMVKILVSDISSQAPSWDEPGEMQNATEATFQERKREGAVGSSNTQGGPAKIDNWYERTSLKRKRDIFELDEYQLQNAVANSVEVKPTSVFWETLTELDLPKPDGPPRADVEASQEFSHQPPLAPDNERSPLENAKGESLDTSRSKKAKKILVMKSGQDRNVGIESQVVPKLPSINRIEDIYEDHVKNDSERTPSSNLSVEGQSPPLAGALAVELLSNESDVEVYSGQENRPPAVPSAAGLTMPGDEVTDLFSAENVGEKKSLGSWLLSSLSEALDILVVATSRRFLTLVLFCTCSMINAFQWIQYSVIANIISVHYGVSESMVASTSMVYLIGYMVLAFPSAWVLDNVGLRITVMLGALGTCIGACIKVFSVGPEQFPIVLLGQFFPAFAQAFIVGVPPRLASAWFKYEEISTACSLGVLGNQLGIALGFVIPPFVVDPVNVERSLFVLCLWVAIASCISFLLVLVAFEEKPAHPPSFSEMLNRFTKTKITFTEALEKLLKDSDFRLLLLSYGINTGTFYAISTLLNPVLLTYFPSEESFVGIIGMSMILAGLFGSWMCGLLLDKTGRFKEVTLVVYVLSTLGTLMYTFVLELRSRWLAFFTCLFMGFFMTGYIPIGLQLGAEITYPLPEGVSSNLLNMAAQAMGLGFILLATNFKNWLGDKVANLILVAALTAGSILTALLRAHLKRQEASIREQSRRSSAAATSVGDPDSDLSQLPS